MDIATLKINTQTLIRSQKFLLVATSAMSAAAGATATYVVVQKKLEAKYKDLSEKEIAEAKEFYAQLRPITEKPASPQEVLRAAQTAEAATALASYQGIMDPDLITDVPSTEEADEKKQTIINIFNNHEPADDGTWDYEHELRQRDEYPDDPYIISHDEYFEGEKEYEQSALTYYEGDDILCDDQSVPVADTEATIGDDNLTRFGHGSKDNNRVYIRNDRLELDFEVARSTGTYTREVLGMEEESELKHSDRRGRSRRGWGDDE